MPLSKLVFGAVALGLLSACAVPLAPVVPRPGDIYQTQAQASTKSEALEWALYTAQETCKTRGMRHVVLEQHTKYQGVVSESVNKTMNRTAAIFTAATAKPMFTLSNPDDYQVDMTFRCEQ